jgi:hypothetical protein
LNSQPRLRPHRAISNVDADALHEREVDHQAAIGGGSPGDAMTSAAHGDLEAGGATEIGSTSTRRSSPAA